MSEFQFACEKCPRTFKLQEFYEKHKKVHDLKKQHRCHICGFVYGAAKGLEGHIKTHQEEEEEIDDDDQSKAEPPYNVDFHFLNPRGVLAQANIPAAASTSAFIKDEEDSPLKNGKVPSPSGTGSYEIFDSVPEVSDASTAVQNDSGFFMCSICSREFSGLNSLKKHIPIHTRRIQHRCDVCGYVFGKKEYLLDHMRKHTGEVSPVCEVCGQTFNKSLKLKEHFKLHRNTNASSSSASPYQCHVCRSVFGRAAILGTHLATAHAETVYKCDICEATFGDVRGKNHHMYNEHQLDAFHQKCVWCPVCNQGFTRHYNLKVHMYKSHGKDYIENNFSAAELAALTKPPPGGSAGGTAKSKGFESPPKNSSPSGNLSLLKSPTSISPAIGKHYFDTKNGTQMLSCQMCSEKFIRKSDLYIHLDSDHGVLLIGCTSCDDKFLDMLELQNHVQLVHPQKTGRKPGPASRTNAPKEIRAKVNVSSAALKCKDCIKVFNDRNAYVAHMRLIHGRLFDVSSMVEEEEESEDEGEIDANNPLAIIIKNLTEAAARKAAKNSNVAESCNFCEKVFDSQSELRDHLINIHIKGFYFNCELCGKAFPHQDNLDAHTKAKHPNLAKRAQHLRNALGLDTEPAAKKSRLEGSLQNATTVLPSNSILSLPVASIASVSSFSSFCNSSKSAANHFPFVRPYSLLPANSITSLLNILTPVLPAELNTLNNNESKKSPGCPVCGVLLSPKTNLNVHLRTHSGVRPYSCVLCLNRFRQKAHLMKHFRCAHDQKRPPHVCQFCQFESSSSNDLYRHIAGRHTNEARYNKPGPLSSKRKQNSFDSMETEEEEVRYEPVTGAFMFEEQVIHPCYVVLPFSTEMDIEKACNPRRNGFHMISEESLDEEVPLTIDESVGNDGDDDDEDEEASIAEPSPMKQHKFEYNAEDLNIDMNSSPGFYPALPDFSLPFTMANLWKKKSDFLGPEVTMQQVELMEKIERMQKYNGSPVGHSHSPSPPALPILPQLPLSPSGLHNNNNSKKSNGNNGTSPKTNGSAKKSKNKSMSPQKNVTGEENAVVTAYENQIQEEIWPLDCIKCNMLLGNLENFNLHMNDHWSEDKCCPVCGLLINSKRFNFKQHLKIHTGEKPFVCAICNRSFRQKAHMVKHVTTHRGVPNISEVHAAALSAK